MTRNRINSFFLAGLVLALTSCAYRAGTIEREIPGGYRSVAIPVFKNSSIEAGVEVYFTNALIREVERARIGHISDKANSQVTLEGSIDEIRYVFGNQAEAVGSNTLKDPNEVAFLPKNTILNTEYRILLTTTLRLRRNSDQTVLWEGSFSGERSYLAPKVGIAKLNSVNALYNHSARYQNIQVMAADLMAEAHDRLTENF